MGSYRLATGAGSMLGTTAGRDAWTSCHLRLLRSMIGSRDTWMPMFPTSGPPDACVTLMVVTDLICSPRILTDGSGQLTRWPCPPPMAPEGSTTGHIQVVWVFLSLITGRRHSFMVTLSPVWLS